MALVECEDCGLHFDESVLLLVERRFTVKELGLLGKYRVLRDAPSDEYERGLMTDVLCRSCAKKEGYIE